jgi:predicted transcriptional regulator
MKVIFLDIDGVLNTGIYATHYFEICKHFGLTRKEAKDWRHGMRDEFGSHFDPRCVSLLKYIIEETGAKIVVSSTWRASGEETMKLMWEMRDLPGEVIGVTPLLNTARGEEIEAYLKENETDAYVIIDDDTDMLPEQKSNFVQTDGEYGITLKDANRIIEILINQGV